MLLWVGADFLVGNTFHLAYWEQSAPLAGLIGAGLNLTRGRAFLWAGAAGLCAGILVVGWTPLMLRHVHGLVRSEPLRQADAVVVLASDLQRDGDLNAISQERILHGLEVLRQGYAPTLVVTQPGQRPHSYVPPVREQMRRLAFVYPIVETAPIYNTREEAVEVARLAREHGWNELVLVTSPTHMRRAAATFEKAGLRVIPSPCVERMFDLETLHSLNDRRLGLRTWLHETIGYEVYRRRGWL